MTSWRTLTTVLLGSALFAAALAPPTVAAKRPTTHSRLWSKGATPLHVAATVARRYWGAEPCNGQTRILARRPLPGGLAPTSAAWATFDSSLGRNNPAAPASSYSNCAIALARWRWPTSTSMLKDWDLFCTTITHELGHLLGHPHDSTQGSVMAPVFADHSSVPRTCRVARPHRSARRPAPPKGTGCRRDRLCTQQVRRFCLRPTDVASTVAGASSTIGPASCEAPELG